MNPHPDNLTLEQLAHLIVERRLGRWKIGNEFVSDEVGRAAFMKCLDAAQRDIEEEFPE